jgi:hypothetical protein
MRVSFLILFVLEGFCSFGQKQTPYEKKEKEQIIKNKIKSVTYFDHSYTNGVFDSTVYKSYYEEYDRKGNAVKSIAYWSDGHVQNQDICKLNKQGLFISCKGEQFDQDGKIKYSSQTYYDSLGTEIKNIYYDHGEVKEKEIYSYNKNGQLIKEETLNPGDTITYIITYKYNEAGLLIEDLGTTSDTDNDGKLYFFTDRKYIYSYDKNGNETESIEYQSNDQISKKTVTVYHNGGREYTVYDSQNNLLNKQVSSYDKKNNWTDWINYNRDDEMTMRSKRIYDKQGLVIEETSFKSGNLQGALDSSYNVAEVIDRIIKFKYEYYR